MVVITWDRDEKLMGSRDLKDLGDALKPATPAVPENKPASKTESFTDRIKDVGNKIADYATGGGTGTAKRAAKNMNYYHEDDGR